MKTERIIRTAQSIKLPLVALLCLTCAGITHAYTTNIITIGIDANDLGTAIPSNYLGMSVGSGNICGGNGAQKYFDPTVYTNNWQWTNIMVQIGIKHMRTIGGPGSNITDADNDTFFNFARNAGVNSIIYSLGDSTPADYESSLYIWSDNTKKSMMDTFAIENESDGGHAGNWTWYFTWRDTVWGPTYTNINDNLSITNGLTCAPFSGPDTASEYPAAIPTAWDDSVNGPGGTPWTTQFAIDESGKLFVHAANQHFYGNGATPAPVWVSGTAFWVNDQAMDTNDPSSPNNKAPYICTNGSGFSSTIPPHSDSGHWARLVPLWASGHSYSQWEFAEETDNGLFYQCANSVSGATEPKDDPAHWMQVSDPSGPDARQMAIYNLDPKRLTEWSELLNGALAGTNTWPLKNGINFPYRLTEFSAYNNGGSYYNAGVGGIDQGQNGNHAGQNFSTALWELDACLWWARHGCTGVDPFDRPIDYSAPIFLSTNQTFVAMPYAYGMLAFNQATHGGRPVNASGLNITNSSGMNLTGYGVVSGNHLYVTLINKTFQTIGQYAAKVTINEPTGFTPTNAAYIVLTSGASGPGSATALGTATLGGATIPVSGSWAGTWTSTTVNGSDKSVTVVVDPCTAMIVDLQE